MLASAYFQNSVQSLLSLYPEEEARALMYLVYEDVLLIKRQHLLMFNKELSTLEEIKLESILTRMKTGEPLQYILGRTWFCGLPLLVNSSVLIPRQETEELVEWVCEELKTNAGSNTLLDIGTGSGCIALALKNRMPTSQIIATDKNLPALKTAEENSVRLKLPIPFHQLDILQQEIDPEWKANIWVSNPPYIPLREKVDMHPNVLGFEPEDALFVPDNDPLLFYRVILEKFSKDRYAEQIYFEVSEYQTTAMQALARDLSLPFRIRKDLNGKNRFFRITR